MSLYRRRTNPSWQKPPRGTSLVRSHSLAPDVCCYPFNEGQGRTLFDHVASRKGTIKDTGSWVIGEKGLAVYHPGSNYDTINLDASIPFFDNDEGSVAFFYKRAWSDAIDSWPTPFKLSDVSNDNTIVLYWHKTNVDWLIDYSGDNVDATNEFAANLIPQNEWVHFIVTWSKDDDLVVVYIDGISVCTVTSLPTMVAPMTRFELPQDGLGNSEGDAYYSTVYGYSYALSADAARALAREPYCMFRSHRVVQQPSGLCFYSDNFNGSNGDAPNSTLWDEEDDDSLMDIQSNKLNFNVTSNSFKFADIDSKWFFGADTDFDIRIDFDSFSAPSPSSGQQFVQFMQINNSAGDVYSRIARAWTAVKGNVYWGFGSSTDSTKATTDSSGKLRITKTSGTVKLYYWSGSQWEWNGSTDGLTASESYTGETIAVNMTWYMILSVTEMFSGNFDNFLVSNGCEYITLSPDMIYALAVASQRALGEPGFTGVIASTSVPSISAIGLVDLTATLEASSVSSIAGIGAAELSALIQVIGVDPKSDVGEAGLIGIIGSGSVSPESGVGDPDLIGIITSSSVPSGYVVGLPALLELAAAIQAFSVDSKHGVGDPILAATIAASSVASKSGVGLLELIAAIQAISVDPKSVTGIPGLTASIGAGSVSSAQQVGTPQFLAVLTATGLPSASALGQPGLLITDLITILTGVEPKRGIGQAELIAQIGASSVERTPIVGDSHLLAILSALGVPSIASLGDPSIVSLIIDIISALGVESKKGIGQPKLILISLYPDGYIFPLVEVDIDLSEISLIIDVGD